MGFYIPSTSNYRKNNSDDSEDTSSLKAIGKSTKGGFYTPNADNYLKVYEKQEEERKQREQEAEAKRKDDQKKAEDAKRAEIPKNIFQNIGDFTAAANEKVLGGAARAVVKGYNTIATGFNQDEANKRTDAFLKKTGQINDKGQSALASGKGVKRDSIAFQTGASTGDTIKSLTVDPLPDTYKRIRNAYKQAKIGVDSRGMSSPGINQKLIDSENKAVDDAVKSGKMTKAEGDAHKKSVLDKYKVQNVKQAKAEKEQGVKYDPNQGAIDALNTIANASGLEGVFKKVFEKTAEVAAKRLGRSLTKDEMENLAEKTKKVIPEKSETPQVKTDVPESTAVNIAQDMKPTASPLETTLLTAAKTKAEERLGRELNPQELDNLTKQTKQVVAEKIPTQTLGVISTPIKVKRSAAPFAEDGQPTTDLPLNEKLKSNNRVNYSNKEMELYRGSNDVNISNTSPDRPVYYAESPEYAETYGKVSNKKVTGRVVDADNIHSYEHVADELGKVIDKYADIRKLSGNEVIELRKYLNRTLYGERLSTVFRQPMPEAMKQAFDDIGVDYIRVPGETFKGTIGQIGHQTEIIELPKPVSTKKPLEPKLEDDTKRELEGTVETPTVKEDIATEEPKLPKNDGNTVSGNASRIESVALEKKLADKMGDLPQYKSINMKEQAAEAIDLIKNDKQKAIDIIDGKANAPGNLKAQSVHQALEDLAVREGDGALLTKLAKSNVNTELSESAQNLRIAAERDPHSAVEQIRQIKDARVKAAEKRSKTTVSKEAKDVKKKVEAATPKATKQDWNSFVKELTC